ncbi:hypothetical protein PCA31118_02417 [Pandoraea captiosa]|uniref:ABC-type transport auxiliary lipoprotein component domain-containing protein n=1 Tax=Pandoraea captiosa TaxID=2508302 RepID=A0A5E5A101_9BURK|nr:hypothetical protein [Pandoraea captiosa]VVE66956.1 hypothetical protein PCA31118_02417 [Pandoraea captiosa]
MRTSVLSCALAALLLSGCSFAPRLPAQQPLGSGIFDQKPEQSPQAKLRGGPNARLAVMLTRNTVANTRYILERRVDYEINGTGNSWSQPYGVLLDASFPLSWVANSLKKQFGTVKQISTLAELRSGSFDGLALVDILYEPYAKGISETTSRVTVTFYDAQGRYVGVAGSREYKVDSGFCCWTYAEVIALTRKQQRPLIDALSEFDANLPSVVDRSASPDRTAGKQSVSAK